MVYTRLRMINYVMEVGMSIPTDIKANTKERPLSCPDSRGGIENISKHKMYCSNRMQILLRVFGGEIGKVAPFLDFDVSSFIGG